MQLKIVNGRLPTPDGETADWDILIEDGVIADIGAPGQGPSRIAVRTVDAAGCLVLPGIVDIHGDAFERQMMPRPGVSLPTDLALVETDRQLVANGITTAFHAMTWSWEPGLRSRAAGAILVKALAEIGSTLACDTRLHLRYETYNFDGLDEALVWIEQGRVGLLAINDHTPSMIDKIETPSKLADLAARAGMTPEDFADLLASVADRADEVPPMIERLTEKAADVRLPMASHDDNTPEVRDLYHSLGCRICEFPQSRETAARAIETGCHVIMGAPNVVRGGSHLGLINAADMVAAGLCDILASDYYYPALPQAPFTLARDFGVPLFDAWRCISENPATAAGLTDRGRIEQGCRADLVFMDTKNDALPRVAGTFVAGQPVFLARGLESLPHNGAELTELRAGAA